METLKDFIRKFTRTGEPEAVSPEYSYRIFWVKQALDWTGEERERVRSEVQQIIQQEDFEANQFTRRYRLEAFDGQYHAGASMLVLDDVLSNLDRIQETGG